MERAPIRGQDRQYGHRGQEASEEEIRFPLPDGIFPDGGAISRKDDGTPDQGSEILGTSDNGASHYRFAAAANFNTEAAATYSVETNRLVLEKAYVYLT